MKDLKIKISAVVVFVFAAAVMFVLSGSKDNERAFELYKQGLLFEQKADYQNAYYNYSKISRFSKLKELALLKQANCADITGDKKTAYNKYKHLSRISKDPNIAPLVLYNAALINIEHKKYKLAYNKLKKLYKNYPDSDYKKAASYHLGVLFFDKKPAHAKDFFIEYLDYAPGGRYALRAADKIRELNIALNSDEKYTVAYALYLAREHNIAYSYVKEQNNAKTAFLCAKILEEAKNNEGAKSAYLKGLALCDEAVDPDEIIKAVSKYAQLSAISYKDACVFLLPHTKNSYARPALLFETAQYLPKAAAQKNYETIYQKYSSSHWAAESLWNMFWHNYKIGNLKKARNLAQSHLSRYEGKNSTPAIKFWHAKILLRENKVSAAKHEFKDLIKTEPGSYYAYVAYNILNSKATPFNTLKRGNLGECGIFSTADLKSLFNNNNNLLIVAKAGDIGTLKKMRLHDDFINSYIAHVEGRVPYSVYIAQKGLKNLDKKPPLVDIRYKLAYPLVFCEQINDNSSAFSQNPYLMIALIREESTFNTSALSPVGASGLMQLMPQTASALGYGELNSDALMNANLNIKLGIKYFSSLVSMFDSNEMLAVLSYNGGPSKVALWKDDITHNDFDEFVEDIPYFETQNYIKKVFGSYWNYIRIYYNN